MKLTTTTIAFSSLLAGAQAGSLRGGIPSDLSRQLAFETGTSYCTYSPDYICYTGGWPACCLEEGATCPKAKPGCNVAAAPTSSSIGNTMDGTSYCTYAPDPTCYLGGWPSCCTNSEETCPSEKPACNNHFTNFDDHQQQQGSASETSSTESYAAGSASNMMTVTSYCTYSPDYQCYSNGWPACCHENASKCPQNKPACDANSQQMTGTSYCTDSPDTQCYKTGWPACCHEDASQCPQEKPACDASHDGQMTGTSYCTWSPDYSCYQNGWPSCCGSSETCPSQRPSCTLASP